MKRRNINAPDAIPPAGGGYSNALEISGFKRIVFVSGQIPVEVNERCHPDSPRNVDSSGPISRPSFARPI